MTQTPPIPPENRSIYPIVEPPHATPNASPAAAGKDKPRDLAPVLVLAGVIASAAAAAFTVLARRKAAAAPPPPKRGARATKAKGAAGAPDQA